MADRGSPLAMELWGNPAVTALIDSRGKLTDAQVGEKLRAEIERERSGGVQYWALFDHRNGKGRSAGFFGTYQTQRGRHIPTSMVGICCSRSPGVRSFQNPNMFGFCHLPGERCTS